MKKTFLALGAAVASLSAITAFAAGTNGSFEEGVNAPSNGWTLLVAGSTALTGWTVGDQNVEVIDTYWQASDGEQSIDLVGVGSGSISQTFATNVGWTYVVTFDLSANPDGGLSVMTLDVSATGAPTEEFSYDKATAGNTRADMKWEEREYRFLATAPTTTLTFQNTTAQAPGQPHWFGPALDNVVITEVAPTKDMCKRGGWESMVDSNANSFKNQGDCVSYFATGGRNAGAGN